MANIFINSKNRSNGFGLSGMKNEGDIDLERLPSDALLIDDARIAIFLHEKMNFNLSSGIIENNTYYVLWEKKDAR